MLPKPTMAITPFGLSITFPLHPHSLQINQLDAPHQPMSHELVMLKLINFHSLIFERNQAYHMVHWFVDISE